MEWLKNLGSAIEYIENNLDKEISHEEAAHIAGYSSPTSFNRAFQSVHGITPVLARNPGSKLNLYPPIRFSVNITGGSALSYHIENKECIRIVGIKTPLTEEIEENMRSVPVFWKNALLENRIPEICQLSNGKPEGILGVSVYNNPEDIYYYIAVPSKEEVPDGMAEYVIPETTWVVFEDTGPFKESVQNIFRRFFTEFLPFSGYQYAQLPDVEVYPANREKGPSEVWFAIRKVNENVSFKIKGQPLSNGRKAGNCLSKKRNLVSAAFGQVSASARGRK